MKEMYCPKCGSKVTEETPVIEKAAFERTEEKTEKMREKPVAPVITPEQKLEKEQKKKKIQKMVLIGGGNVRV